MTRKQFYSKQIVRPAGKSLPATLLAGIFALSSLGVIPPVAQQPAFAQPAQIPADALVRFAGSPTLAESIIPPLGAAWAKKLALSSTRIQPGADAEEYMIVAEAAESARKMRLDLKFKGTATGLEPLLRGQTDF